MISRHLIFCALGLVPLLSCTRPTDSSNSFFDSLVQSQAVRLAASKATLVKSASFKAEHAETRFVPDVLGWEHELDVFRQLSAFEKPAYRSDYDVRDRVRDGRSNLLIRSYISKKRVPVPELRFYYYNDVRNLKKIEGVFQETNALFSTMRKLTVEFETIGDHTEIKDFEVEGVQKMIGSDSVPFIIRSSVHH